MANTLNLSVSYLIETLGCSRREFARRIDISLESVEAWINGESTPSVSSIYEICRIYGVSADFLLGLTNHPFRPGTDEDSCFVPTLASLEDLTPSQRNVVHMLLSEFRAENIKKAPPFGNA